MSDLAATNCGCGCEPANNGCGFGSNIIWILLLLCCCGGWGHNNCGFSGDNSCIWIILLLFCCGGWGGSGGGFCC